MALLHIPLILRNTPPELAPFLSKDRRVAGLHRAVSLHLSWWERFSRRLYCSCAVQAV